MVLFVEKENMGDWLKKLVLLVEKVCNESEIETLVTIFHILEINSVRIFFILFIIFIIFNMITIITTAVIVIMNQ